MTKVNIDDNLKKLSAIAEWFENREEVDIEEGIAKVKEAAVLIKESKARLSHIENEFEEIKKEIDPDFSEETVVVEERGVIEIEKKTVSGEYSDDMPF